MQRDAAVHSGSRLRSHPLPALTKLSPYPALTYGVDGDGIYSANFRIIGVGNRDLSGIIYRIKVACV